MIQEYSIFDIGFDKYLSRGTSVLEAGNALYNLPMPSILGSGFYEIPPGQIGSGELVGNITMVTGLLQSYNYVSGSAGWIVNYDGSAEFSDITLYGGTIKYGKTSFTDSVHSGYWLGSSGFYIGGASDATKFKFTISDGSLGFIGNLLNSAGSTILNSSATTILKDFTFSPTDYSGAFKAGDIAWSASTGVIASGSGIVIYKKGIVGAKAGVTTFSIDATTGNATFAGTLSGASGTFGTITSGIINGCSINVPSAGSPLFSVDSSGNCKVKSLERDDFHWFTNFESIDGYAQSIGGAGTIICNPQSVDFTTGANNTDSCELQKTQPAVSSYFSWDKDRKFKTLVKLNSNSTVWLNLGTGQNQAYAGNTDRHIGFYFIGGQIYATVADGTTETSVSNIFPYSTSSFQLLEVKYYAGVRAEFYVNGVLRTTITTHLPSGTANAQWYFDTKLFTLGGVKILNMVYWDFWQAN